MNDGYTQINKLSRENVESSLNFAGFLVFHCPLKDDAVDSLKMLADSSHRVSQMILHAHRPQAEIRPKCIMITGDSPLTAVHVAREVEIVDRDVLILDVQDNFADNGGKKHSVTISHRLI
jgi:cation-transporting ATPase 13A1